MNIGSCWKKTSTAGKDYLSGVIQSPFVPEGEIRFAIFKVDEKKSDNSPDYTIVWSKAKKDPSILYVGNPTSFPKKYNDLIDFYYLDKKLGVRIVKG